LGTKHKPSRQKFPKYTEPESNKPAEKEVEYLSRGVSKRVWGTGEDSGKRVHKGLEKGQGQGNWGVKGG